MKSSAEAPRTSLPYLFIGSVATLFLEMTLIRWVSTEVRVFAYVQNLALIACFLGFGLGCYYAGQQIRYRLGTICTCALVLMITYPAAPWRGFLLVISELLTLSPDSAMWASVDPTGKSLARYIALAVVVATLFLILMIGAMFPLGQYIGKALDDAKRPISAYSVNLAGSLIGGWLLAGLSFMQTRPLIWFALCFVLISALRHPRRLVLTFFAMLAFIAVGDWMHPSERQTIVWSPYQKLEVAPLGEGDYYMAVNNTGYMSLAHPRKGENVADSSYDSPYRFIGDRGRVLVVGSGGGNDVASALRNGAGQVDAVEIDPAIVSFGRRYHPDHPYDSKSVNVIVNDARNYMRTTSARYDAIIFGLLDSHTVLSGLTNMRVDNYVYTEEAFREAVRLLKPDGVLVLRFEVRAPWLWMGLRFDSMLTRVAGRAPIAYHSPPVGHFFPASVFLTSKSSSLFERAGTAEQAKFLVEHPPVFTREADSHVPGTSDDWPYVYHRARTIPRTHLTITVILLLIGVALVGRKLRVRDGQSWQFFFLGAGFLCLETQMVSRCALYFGSTWLVNCFVISTVLIVLVAANLALPMLAKPNRTFFFCGLILSLVLIYLIPWGRIPIGALPTGLLLLAAYGIPLFCAGILFADSFKRCERKSAALGANLFGATLGGVAQNLSFVFGLKSLLIVGAVFYAAAWFAIHRAEGGNTSWRTSAV